VLWPGWVDSDWAADVETRRSHTGYILMLNGGAQCFWQTFGFFGHFSPSV
jgi:hypothetical protein